MKSWTKIKRERERESSKVYDYSRKYTDREIMIQRNREIVRLER